MRPFLTLAALFFGQLLLIWNCLAPALAQSQTAFPPNTRLEKKLEKLAEKWGIRLAGLAVLNLTTQELSTYQGNKPFYLRGLASLPILLESQRQIQERELSEGSILEIRRDHFLTRNSQYLPGEAIELRTALKWAIQKQDPNILHLLAERLGVGKIQRLMQVLGLKQTRFPELERNQPEANRWPVSTAHDQALLMAGIFHPWDKRFKESAALAKTLSERVPVSWLALPQSPQIVSVLSEDDSHLHLLASIKTINTQFVVSVLSSYPRSKYLQEALQGLLQDLFYLLNNQIPYAPLKNEVVSGIYLHDQGFKGKVVLSFDDGPIVESEQVLDVLKRHQVPATFFVLGGRLLDRRGDVRPEIVSLFRRILNEGHTIGSHTYDHPKMPLLSPVQIYEQLELTQEAVEKTLGHEYPLRYFRPPFGLRACNCGREGMLRPGEIDEILKVLKYELILWQADSQDWRVKAGQIGREQMRENIFKQLAKNRGGVVLLHDTHEVTREMLEEIILGLKKQGYQFTSLDELMLLKYQK